MRVTLSSSLPTLLPLLNFFRRTACLVELNLPAMSLASTEVSTSSSIGRVELQTAKEKMRRTRISEGGRATSILKASAEAVRRGTKPDLSKEEERMRDLALRVTTQSVCRWSMVSSSCLQSLQEESSWQKDMRCLVGTPLWTISKRCCLRYGDRRESTPAALARIRSTRMEALSMSHLLRLASLITSSFLGVSSAS